MKLSKEVEEVLRMAVERVYLRWERAPVTHVIDEVRAIIAEKNAIRIEGEAVLKMPSRTSIYRYIERLDAEEVDTARKGLVDGASEAPASGARAASGAAK